MTFVSFIKIHASHFNLVLQKKLFRELFLNHYEDGIPVPPSLNGYDGLVKVDYDLYLIKN